MSFEDLAEKLASHEMASTDRFHKLQHAIKESKMSDTPHVKNVFEPVVNPMGGMGFGYPGYGGAGAGGLAGAGAGVLGGLLGGALLGNGGLFGNNRNGEGCVTPTQLTAALTGVQDQNSFSALMQGQARIEASIPAAEGQVQLALAQTQNALANQINTNLVSNTQGFANTNQNISQAQAAVIAVGETVKDTVNMTSAATQLAIANSIAQGLVNTNNITTAVRDDGDKTRALIIAQNEANLTRQLAVAEATLARQELAAASRGTEVNVTQMVNQAQAQAQTQQQQQQQILLLNSIAGHLVGLQNAVATNSNMIIGNTGATTTGAQTANPVNVRT